MLTWSFFVDALGQDLTGDTIQIPYFSGEINIDGDISDWKHHGSFVFSDTATFLHSPEEWSFEKTLGHLNTNRFLPPRSRNSVVASFCWNLHGLYFAFEVKDGHLMAEIAESQDKPEIYVNDAIEVYIDSKCDSKIKMDINDYQFVVDVQSKYTVLKGDRQQWVDSTKYYVPKDYGQNILIEAGAVISGTINDTADRDEGYIIEVGIPFEAIGIKPAAGTCLKLDICNDDNDYFLTAYNYTELMEIYTRPFNWIGLNNFGFPDFWRPAKLTGGPDWFEGASLHLKKRWLISVISIIILTLIALIFVLLRIARMKRIPALAEVEKAKILFIRQDPDEKENLTANHRYLQEATDYILQNCRENIRSEEIANHLCISLRKFQLITREELNCTPTSFIYIVKLNKAAEFIKNNQGNISEAAYNFGFSSPSYFTKIFKSHFGMTPVEYKKNENSLHNSAE
ncbi:MAG: helix-turn-helix domain-containing protein [Bacteroidales bacterium]|nr:helix-turn-helix domain-containing protein [Bacteroidales bacterium]